MNSEVSKARREHVTRHSVIWRLQRGGDHIEAVVNEQPDGECELRYLRNGSMLHRIWLAWGCPLAAIEVALDRRQLLKMQGWREARDC
jgi:hypothetical protein